MVDCSQLARRRLRSNRWASAFRGSGVRVPAFRFRLVSDFLPCPPPLLPLPPPPSPTLWQVKLAERRDFGAHIRRTAAADVVADSFTYNAHTTAVDAIYAGVPVVTLAGDVIQSRLAAGALGALGPGSETLSRTREDYALLLQRLVTKAKALERIRRRMAFGARTGLESRPLFDTEGWFRDFEGCLLLMVDVVIHGGGAARGTGWPGVNSKAGPVPDVSGMWLCVSVGVCRRTVVVCCAVSLSGHTVCAIVCGQGVGPMRVRVAEVQARVRLV